MSGPLPARQPVTRRHVYFLSGFDPKGAAHYHALYQTQARQQSGVNSMKLQVESRQRDSAGNSFWEVNSTAPDGARCQTTYEFSRWDDIVRQHWQRSTWRLLLEMQQAYRLMLSSGELSTVWRLSRKTMVGLVYPLAVLGGGLVAGLAAGFMVAAGLRGLGAAWPMAVAAGLVMVALILWGTRKLEDKLNTTWLVRIFSFSGKQACGNIPELQARLDAVAERIAQKIRTNDVDEILVVGFSVGSILAVSSMARALAAADEKGNEGSRPAVSLLTLGHCIPLLGLFPQAKDFRAELGALAKSRVLYWADFSSPTDWGSFALVDPIAACRIEVQPGARKNPLMRSPRFHTMFAPATYAGIKRDKRRMHMQYLMASELSADYDYFAITSGPLTLRERYPPGTA